MAHEMESDALEALYDLCEDAEANALNGISSQAAAPPIRLLSELEKSEPSVEDEDVIIIETLQDLCNSTDDSHSHTAGLYRAHSAPVSSSSTPQRHRVSNMFPRGWKATLAERCGRCLLPLLSNKHDVQSCFQTFTHPALPCPQGADCSKQTPAHYASFNHRSLRTRLLKTAALSQDQGRDTETDDCQHEASASHAHADKATPRPKQAKLHTLFSWPQPAHKAVLGDRALPASHASKKERKCPFYKRIESTNITVDAFSYGTIEDCKAYFLSHFHYDHYGGLTSSFQHTLYCSEITGRLVIQQLNVTAPHVIMLPMNTRVKVLDVHVTLLEANHCPGAVLFLFELANGKRILHTGDFRACPEMWQHACMQEKRIDCLYLDTTYCSEQYCFPSQSAVLNFVASLAIKQCKKNDKCLVLVGSYTIGKERVFRAIAHALGSHVWAEQRKRRIFETFQDAELNSMLTTQRSQAQVHVVSMQDVRMDRLQEVVKEVWFRQHFKHVLAFKPTGWTHQNKLPALSHIRPTCKQNITLYGIPYSEHSSFKELQQFVCAVKPARILPTVNNGSAKKRAEMAAYFAKWLNKTLKSSTST